MAVREDSRAYATSNTPKVEIVRRCRAAANGRAPFACPEHCLFFESRSITDAGWRRFDDTETGSAG